MPNTTYGTPYAQSSDLVSNWPGVSSNVADRIDDVSFKGNGLNDQTGTSYTLVLTDAGKTVTLNNASAVTVTIPSDASVAYETGTVIELTNKGAGIVTVSPAGGVTLNNSSTLPQNASAHIRKLATNTWVMVNPISPGLQFITAATFTGSSAVNVNNCFTSTYTNYQILVNITAASTNVVVALRLRVSGSDASGASDYRNIFVGNSSTNADQRNTSATSWFLIGQSATGGPSMTTCTVFRPNEAASTQAISSNFGSTGSTFYGLFYSSQHSLATAYDGFTLLPDTGTFTGSLRVFGYRNS